MALKASVLNDISRLCDFCEKHLRDDISMLYQIQMVLDEDFTNVNVLRNSLEVLQEVLEHLRALDGHISELQKHIDLVTKLIDTLASTLASTLATQVAGGGRARARGGGKRHNGMRNDTHAGLTALLARLMSVGVNGV